MSNSTELNYIFFGHQNRFKQYLIDSFNECIVNAIEIVGAQEIAQRIDEDKLEMGIIKTKIDTKIRFCNGAILCLKVNKENVNVNLELSLIYEGDTLARKKDKPYWTIRDSSKDLKPFKPYTLTIPLDNFKKIFKISNDFESPLNLYFVRHGFSYHNKGLFSRNPLKTNTELEKLPVELRELIKNINDKDVMNEIEKMLDDSNLLNDTSLGLYSQETKMLKKQEFNKILKDTLGNFLGCLIINDYKVSDDLINCRCEFYVLQNKLKNKLGKMIPGENNESLLDYILRVLNNDEKNRLKAQIVSDNKNELNNVFITSLINNIFIKKNGELQSIKAGKYFSIVFGNNVLNGVLVSDLIRTQETASFFLSQLTPSQFPAMTPVIVLPCMHELRGGEKDGQITFSKVFSQVSRIGTLGTTQGALNRENNTNCRATAEEKSSSINMFERKDCSQIKMNDKSIYLNWDIYKNFYKGYRDQNNLGRQECKNNHFIGIFFDDVVSLDKNVINGYNNSYSPIINNDDSPRSSISDDSFVTAENNGYHPILPVSSDDSVASENSVEVGGKKKWFGLFGGTKKRKLKSNRKLKSKKVRKMKRTKKTKKGKRRETRRK